MEYDFFFSYTRGNNNVYLQKFFDDLSTELREQRGYSKDKKVGFIDQREIELGEEWDNTIVEALQKSKVLICIYSPGYFNSPYCGKEWQIFQERRNAYLKLSNSQVLPPVIKPVLWMSPLPSNMEDAVKRVQYLFGNPDDVQNKQGLKYMLQKFNEYNNLYVDYIHELATQVREAADNYTLPILNPFPSLTTIKQAFPIPEAQSGKLPNLNFPKAEQKPNHVRFVFVAGNPKEFGNLRSPDAYLDNGGSDWRPFPGMGRIGPYVQHIVSAEDLDFVSDELPLNDNLIQEIEKAYEERKIIIFIVDGWTINWKHKYRYLLNTFDRRSSSFINCSVLIPWNEADPDVFNHREEIDKVVRLTFDFRANLWKNPIFYRDPIYSLDELRNALREVLTGIKAEMHKRSEGGKAIPSQISKPVISNQL